MRGRITLNKRLVLEGPVRAPDGAGGFSEQWQELGAIWAEVAPRTGRERGGEAVSLSATGFRITVRAAPQGAPSRPRAGQRFRDGGRLFRIEAVTERDAQARFLTCFATEEVVP